MRTVCSSGRIWGGDCFGGCLLPGGVCLVPGAGCLLQGGVCSHGGCLLQGVCLLRGVSALGEGACVWSWGCLLWGVSAPGKVSTGGCLLRGCLLQGVSGGVSVTMGGNFSYHLIPGGGRCLVPGREGGVCSRGVVSQHTLRQTPPPPCGQTHACKNITFATSLRTVKSACSFLDDLSTPELWVNRDFFHGLLFVYLWKLIWCRMWAFIVSIDTTAPWSIHTEERQFIVDCNWFTWFPP